MYNNNAHGPRGNLSYSFANYFSNQETCESMFFLNLMWNETTGLQHITLFYILIVFINTLQWRLFGTTSYITG